MPKPPTKAASSENKYDTRGLEAAYLAGGQARQLRDILDSIQLYEKLPVKNFAPGEPIDLTALVELETNGDRSFYFIGPKSGGLELKHQRKEIMVITPQSPLGTNLLGKKSGDRWTAPLAGQNVKYHIASVL